MENTTQTTEDSLRIPVTSGPALKSGTQIVTGFLPANALIPDNYRIPYRDSVKKTGYQRPPQQQRINDLASDLRQKRVDLPTAVLLNIRDRGAREAVTRNGDGALILDFAELVQKRRGAGAYFFVVDGQHRVLALEKLMAEDPERWASFVLPFVCMLGADENEEMDQFYVVNSKAKSVRTDLAYALLKERADRDSTIYKGLVERAREWQVDGQTLVEKLAETSPIWKHRIRLPAMEKGETTISNTSLVNSLKPLLTDSPFFKRSQVDQRLKLLEAYWQGIRLLMRDAFDNPTSYSLQKGVGVMVLHEILPDVIEIVRAAGKSVVEPTAYEDVLRPVLDELEGDNANGDTVKGGDFWRAAPDGAAGSYSGSAGRRVLTAKLRQLLPSIEVE